MPLTLKLRLASVLTLTSWGSESQEKVRWLSEHREHLYISMPPAHFILQRDKTLWGPTAPLRMSFSHTEPLSQISLHKSPQNQPPIFEEASQTSHKSCFVPPDSELPLVLSQSFVPSSHSVNHLMLLIVMDIFSVYSMRHLARSMTSIHSVALWEPFPWVLPIFTLMLSLPSRQEGNSVRSLCWSGSCPNKNRLLWVSFPKDILAKC